MFGSEETAEDVLGGHVVRIAFDTGADTEFDYIVPDRFWPVQVGQRLEVPFGRGNKLATGFCVAVIDEAPEEQKSRRFKLKVVKKVIDNEPLIDNQLMDLARWISTYYVCPLGQVLAAVVPAAVKKGAGVRKQSYVYLYRPGDDNADLLTSRKQKVIVDILHHAGALDSDSGVAKAELLESAQCTAAPLKQLLRKEIVRIEQKEILRALPAVPAGRSLKQATIELNSDQRKALAHIADQLDSNRFGVTLLHGVTDSGKTEVYIRAIARTVERGRTAIVLLPEIALTAQTVQRFKSRFGRLAVLHSQLTGPQRNAQWRQIKAQKADVVIGARSAVFAPVSNLGLIVVDEEHEPGYKQDTTPRYHGRDVAIKRVQLAGGHCLLGSATPALETLHNCDTKEHYTCVSLPRRVMDLPMPEMKLVDMSGVFVGTGQKGVHLLSPVLKEHLTKV
ncbi:MAG: DEAD/DEAH box helicase, partial [Planctomycetes bacterium]|nr:DEAD/DEAH box helicase [Planctomycetota bacterium]